jgi:hypothetical protein
MRFCLVLLTGLSLAACSDTASPTLSANRVFAHSLNGEWATTIAPPGQSLDLLLRADGATIHATGSFSAGQTTGTVLGSGTVTWRDDEFVPAGRIIPAHSDLDMNLDYSDGRTAYLNQARVTDDTLQAALTFTTSTATSTTAISYFTEFVRK